MVYINKYIQVIHMEIQIPSDAATVYSYFVFGTRNVHFQCKEKATIFDSTKSSQLRMQLTAMHNNKTTY
jgi:hypothetical protein